MILTKDDLKTVAYSYQLNEISEMDDDIILYNLEAAEEEVLTYLNSKYNLTEIKASPTPLVKEIIKNVAMWNLIRLCNPDIIYDQWKDRYDRAIKYLHDVSSGTISPAGLPHKTDDQGDTVTTFRLKSNTKFNHF